MAKTRAEQETKEPFTYQARFDENGHPLEPVAIYDYHTGSPISAVLYSYSSNSRPSLPQWPSTFPL